MAKDPAFTLYSQDFLTGTMFMSNEEVGKYIRLLCAQHQHGGIIKKVDFNSISGESEVLKSKFIESEDGFYNERLLLEMGKRQKKSTNLSANAKKRWENTIQKQCNSNAIAYTGLMPTENENENVLKGIVKGNLPKEKIEGMIYPDSDLENKLSMSDCILRFARKYNKTEDQIRGMIKEFVIAQESPYHTFKRAIEHFGNWIPLELKRMRNSGLKEAEINPVKDKPKSFSISPDLLNLKKIEK